MLLLLVYRMLQLPRGLLQKPTSPHHVASTHPLLRARAHRRTTAIRESPVCARFQSLFEGSGLAPCSMILPPSGSPHPILTTCFSSARSRSASARSVSRLSSLSERHRYVIVRGPLVLALMLNSAVVVEVVIHHRRLARWLLRMVSRVATARIVGVKRLKDVRFGLIEPPLFKLNRHVGEIAAYTKTC